MIENLTLDPEAGGVRSMIHGAGAFLSGNEGMARTFGYDFSSDVAFARRYGIDRKLPGKGSDYILGTVSDSRIVGRSVTTGNNISLAFNFDDKTVVTSPIKFTFTLLHTKDRTVKKHLTQSSVRRRPLSTPYFPLPAR